MSKATYGALLFAPEREVAKRAVLDQFSTIAENISAPIQNKKGDETYGVRLRGGVDVSIRVFGKKKTASYIAGMKHLYKAASWNNEYLYGRIMYRIESCVSVVECDYKAKSSHKTSNTYEPFSPQGAFDAEELEASVTKALMTAARETDGLVRLPNLEIRNGSNDLVFNLEGKNEQYSESRPDELNDYFATDKALGQRLVKMSLGKLSLPTGEIIACDPFVFLDDAQPFVHRVTPGTYEVEAAVILPEGEDACTTDARIAAVRVRFSDASAAYYEPAQTAESFTGEMFLDAEDKTKERKANEQATSDPPYLFAASGTACICDVRTWDVAMRALSDYEAGAGEDFVSTFDYFEDVIAKSEPRKFYSQSGKEVFYEHSEDIYNLEWNVPKTDYRIPLFSTGYGEGVYPVWFGFDETGKICSLLFGFIDLKEERYANPPKKKPSIANPLLVLIAALVLGAASVDGLMTGELIKVKFLYVHPAITMIAAVLMLIGGGIYLVSTVKKRKAFPLNEIDKKRRKIIGIVTGVVLVLAAAILAFVLMGAIPKTSLDNVRAGNTVRLGEVSFVNGYVAEGSEDLVWRVLAIEDERVLLITEKCIDFAPYAQSQAEEITWEQSTLRQWLNSEFYESLPEEMRQRVLVTQVINDGNPQFGTPGGADTEDRVFLLSIEEAEQYFSSDKDRSAKIDIVTGNWGWWLRSPGYEPQNVAGVHYEGRINYYGDDSPDVPYGVRPALWISRNV